MGTGHLTGVMDKVACYKCLLPLRCDTHTDMSRGMAGRRFEPHFIAQFVIVLDCIYEASGKHRVYAVTHVIAELLLFPLPRPVFVFATGNEVTRVLKRWLPIAIHQHRVPPDVVNVKVSAQDVVETARRKPCG